MAHRAARHFFALALCIVAPAAIARRSEPETTAIHAGGTGDYSLVSVEQGVAHAAVNAGQAIRARFRDGAMYVEPTRGSAEEGSDWSWELRYAGVPGLAHDAPTEVVARGSRLEYHRGPIVEWFENRPTGIEHGFVIEERIEASNGSELRVDLEVRSELRMQPLRDDSGYRFLTATGQAVLTYDKLVVVDATGRELDARFEARASTISILVDVREARYPILIDPLVTTSVWYYEPDIAGAELGSAVANAGDVNGDGRSDILIGSPAYSYGFSTGGRAELFFGGCESVEEDSAWDYAPTFMANARCGEAVAGIGDVNGDGYADIAVGAPMYGNGEVNEGSVFVFYGSAIGPSILSDWDYEPDQAGENFGTSIAHAGDVNGDGYSDMLVGASGYNGDDGVEGRAYIFLGGPGGLATTPAWTVEGNQGGSEFGACVAAAGDVDADGYDDIAVGAPKYDDPLVDQGQVRVYLGSALGPGAVSAATLTGASAGNQFGQSIAGGGDVDRDGYGDLVVGAPAYSNGHPSEGAAFVFQGSAGGLATSASVVLESDYASAELGTSVATGGDFDGDGYSDVMCGAPFANGSTGAVYGYRGSASGVVPTLAAFVLAPGDRVGAAIAVAGDVDQDGRSDFLVGAPLFDGPEVDEGYVQLIRGRTIPLNGTANWTDTYPTSITDLTRVVSTAGDVDGDGYSDLAVGIPAYSDGSSEVGAVSIFHGSPSGLPVSANWFKVGESAAESFGGAVATAGDVNGDGYSDVAVGSPDYSNGESTEGRVQVFHGSATGLAGEASWSAESDSVAAHMGQSLASAGDVNGDGYSDLIVGLPTNTFTFSQEGAAGIYLGASSGLSTTLHVFFTGDESNTQFGHSVAGVGDLDGNGYCDIAIGSPNSDLTNTDAGKLLVFFSDSMGVGNTPTVIAPVNLVSGHFGYSVAGVGDIESDGFMDIVASAPNWGGSGIALSFSGHAGGIVTTDTWFATGTAGSNLGSSVAPMGDADGDGFDDFAVGQPEYSVLSVLKGRVKIVRGTASGPTSYADLDAPTDVLHLGRSVAYAGDVNGDGYGDLGIGATYVSPLAAPYVHTLVHFGGEAAAGDLHAQALRRYSDAPVATGAMAPGDGFRLACSAMPTQSGAEVRFEWQVFGEGSTLPIRSGVSEDWIVADSSGASETFTIADLPEGGYSWQVRTHYRATTPVPHPTSRWVRSPHRNARGTDVRVVDAGAILSLDSVAPIQAVVTLGAGAPGGATRNVSNIGAAPLSWAATTSLPVSWLGLGLNGAAGMLPSDTPLAVPISFVTTGLPVGEYATTLRFTNLGDAADYVDVPVTLTIEPPSFVPGDRLSGFLSGPGDESTVAFEGIAGMTFRADFEEATVPGQVVLASLFEPDGDLAAAWFVALGNKVIKKKIKLQASGDYVLSIRGVVGNGVVGIRTTRSLPATAKSFTKDVKQVVGTGNARVAVAALTGATLNANFSALPGFTGPISVGLEDPTGDPIDLTSYTTAVSGVELDVTGVVATEPGVYTFVVGGYGSNSQKVRVTSTPVQPPLGTSTVTLP